MLRRRIGLKHGAGFVDYEGRDVEACRGERLQGFVALLGHFSAKRPPEL